MTKLTRITRILTNAAAVLAGLFVGVCIIKLVIYVICKILDFIFNYTPATILTVIAIVVIISIYNRSKKIDPDVF